MVAQGEAPLAWDFAAQLGLPPSALPLAPGDAAAAEAARAAQYLQLGLPPGDVVVVDAPGGLAAAGADLAAAAAVGVDVEWCARARAKGA